MKNAQMRNGLCLIVWFGLLLNTNPRVLASPLFDVTLIEVPGASYSLGQDINNNGTVFLSAQFGTQFHAFSYSSAANLVALFPTVVWGVSAGNDLNKLVGNTTTTGLFGDSLSGLQVIPHLGGATRSNPTAINNAGQVVASAVKLGEPFLRSYLWDSITNRITLLDPSLSYYSFGKAINELGAVVGEAWQSTTSPARKDAFHYTPEDGFQILQRLGGAQAQAFGINDAGVIVGWSEFSALSDYHAVMWDEEGIPLDLGTLGGNTSDASAINDRGQIVGQSRLPTGFSTHAFLYEDGQMRDLNALIDPSLGVEIFSAQDINDMGQILVRTSVGIAVLTPVPEPHSTAMLLLGSAAILLIRRR